MPRPVVRVGLAFRLGLPLRFGLSISIRLQGSLPFRGRLPFSLLPRGLGLLEANRLADPRHETGFAFVDGRRRLWLGDRFLDLLAHPFEELAAVAAERVVGFVLVAAVAADDHRRHPDLDHARKHTGPL